MPYFKMYSKSTIECNGVSRGRAEGAAAPSKMLRTFKNYINGL